MGLTSSVLVKAKQFQQVWYMGVIGVRKGRMINLFLLINRTFFRIIFVKIIFFFQSMQSSSQLFEEIPAGMFQLLQENPAPTLRNHFIINQTLIQLSLTDQHLLLYPQPNALHPTHFCKLTFSLKFEVIFESNFSGELVDSPIAIKFERENCTQQLTFLASHPSIAKTWSLELEKKINQRNFHKLFKAKKKIGKGAFATVYLAERLRDHKMVAVKAFSKEKQYSGDKGRESLENEIQLMRRLNHSNIMRLEGVYETENSVYVILEYLEGMQLNEMLKSGKKIEAQEARQIIRNILQGLGHLSKNRIIHRDLKPENIMFRQINSQDLAICDFGLATHAEQEKYLFVRCGTPGFVAPEIINIKDMTTKSDPISDIFSAGIIFHYLLFSCSIFEGKKYNEILVQNRSCEFDFTKEMYANVDRKTFDLLRKMLEKDPSRRISAQMALKHPYFTGEMEIECSENTIFKEMTNAKSIGKFSPETPSSMTKKVGKQFFSVTTSKQNPKPFIFS